MPVTTDDVAEALENVTGGSGVGPCRDPDAERKVMAVRAWKKPGKLQLVPAHDASQAKSLRVHLLGWGSKTCPPFDALVIHVPTTAGTFIARFIGRQKLAFSFVSPLTTPACI